MKNEYIQVLAYCLLGLPSWLLAMKAGEQAIVIDQGSADILGLSTVGVNDEVAHQMVGMLYDDMPGQQSLVVLLEQEMTEYPEAIQQLSQRGGRLEDDMQRRLLLTGRVLAEILKKTNEEKNRKEAEAREKGEQLQYEEKKSFWSILTAVGSAVLAVASTAWGAVEATTGPEQAQVVVDVVCNCTSALV